MDFQLFNVEVDEAARFEPHSIRLMIQREGEDQRWVMAYVMGTVGAEKRAITVLQNTLCTMGEVAHIQELADRFDNDPYGGWERLIGAYHLRRRYRAAAALRAKAAWELRGARIVGDEAEISAWETAVKAIANVMNMSADETPERAGEDVVSLGSDGLISWERDALSH